MVSPLGLNNNFLGSIFGTSSGDRQPLDANSPVIQRARKQAEEIVPRLLLKSALQSDSKLGQPPGEAPTDPDHVSNVHSEVKVNGKTVARAYNDGNVELAPQYKLIEQVLEFDQDTSKGPALAEDRIARIQALLQDLGATFAQNGDGPNESAFRPSDSVIVQVERAETAQSLEDYLAEKVKNGETEPGLLISTRI
ncbi:hypothetical protein H2509_07425 [Stappia sp. F7233]|uniref:Uncharacterized protein n=1 Tax=Stappia albiluteola TaxID=2758565 RepID=A0A839ABB2_9HYPH|nr:hypothetical protein [Stappia albiluteola]MBA5776960.1 hypothetical protein [Stappia albiluteola]